MRILHILDHSIPLHSGYAFRTLSILEQQRSLGWQTVHLTTPRHDTEYRPVETVDGWEFHRTRRPSGPLARLPVLGELAEMRATARRLAEVAASVRPDILHAHSPVLNALPTLRVGRRLGLPVVYEVRALWEDAAVDHGTARENGVRYRLSRALETRALRRVDAITTICEGLRKDIMGRGIGGDRITVVPNAVNLAEFPDSCAPDPALAAELGLTGRTVLGFVGSFYAYEGLHLLLGGFAQILKSMPETRVLLVGSGPEESRLRSQTAALGLGDKVIFAGRVEHAEIARYYGLMDVMIYPRIAIRLTDLVTPLKPLEAMAQRKIVVASDVGGHHELIRDGETGNLFTAGDSGALVATVLRVLGDRANWDRQRDLGRRYVEAERSWQTIATRYRPVYESLIGG